MPVWKAQIIFPQNNRLIEQETSAAYLGLYFGTLCIFAKYKMYLYESVCKRMSFCMCAIVYSRGAFSPCNHGYQVVCPPMGPYLMTMKKEKERKQREMGRYRERTSFVCPFRPSNKILLHFTLYNVITSSM